MSSLETGSNMNFKFCENEVEDNPNEDLVRELPVNVGRQIPDVIVPIVNI